MLTESVFRTDALSRSDRYRRTPRLIRQSDPELLHQVRNTCKGAMKVEVQMKYGTDHPCTRIAKGKTVHFNSKGIKVWKATVRC
ncbi:hypothetical protein [Streptomyces sp. NPDC018321]|uniref:hypothetical protein n=1 Tax=unclassified Streptomyces TaxID=2593676 RepID=UPI0037A9D833